MKETSISPGTELEEVPTVLRALANRFGRPVFAYFNGYRVDSTMTDEEIIDGYRSRWEENHKKMKKLLYFIAALFAAISMASCSYRHSTEETAETIYVKKGERVLSASIAYGGHVVILTETADSTYTPNVKTLVEYYAGFNGDVDSVITIYKLVEQ